MIPTGSLRFFAQKIFCEAAQVVQATCFALEADDHFVDIHLLPDDAAGLDIETNTAGGGTLDKLRFDGRVVSYDTGQLDELNLAYACSIHKAQGSEYPVVVLVVHTQHYVMLKRNLVYTGITRGKHLVVVVGTKRAMAMAVKSKPGEARRTGLRGRLVR